MIRKMKIQCGARNIVSSRIAVAADVLNDTMPDRGSAGDTDRVYHGGVISVASPDTDNHIGSIAHGPVIRKIIGSTGLSCHFRMRAIRKCLIPHRKYMIIQELWVTSTLIF